MTTINWRVHSASQKEINYPSVFNTKHIKCIIFACWKTDNQYAIDLLVMI